MSVTVQIEGELLDASDVVLRFIRDTLKSPWKGLGEYLQARMKFYCPVLTGNLRDSIGLKVVSYEQNFKILLIVGPARRKMGRPTRYAHLVEFGHRAGGWHKEAGGKFVPAKPFVRPTAEIARASAVKFVGPGASQALSVAVERAKGGGKKKVWKLVKKYY